jgi:hypothetical protein
MNTHSPSDMPQSAPAILAKIYDILTHLGYTDIFVGGSSARHIIDKKWAAIRDIDIYIVCDNPLKMASLAAIKNIIYNIATAIPTFAKINIPQSKYRANADFQDEIIPIQVGYGTHLHTIWQDFPIFSLNIVHSFGHLSHNGLFDIDTIFLRLSSSLHFDIIDRHNGRQAYLDKNPILIHWTEYQRGYPRHILRVVRTFFALGTTQLPDNLIHIFSEKNKNIAIKSSSPQELHRDILKTFLGEHWLQKWQMAAELGFFEPNLQLITALKNIFADKNIAPKVEKYVASATKKLPFVASNKKIAFLRLHFFLLQCPKEISDYFIPIFEDLQDTI